MTDRLSNRRGAPRARNLELALTLLVLGGALPAVAVSLFFLSRYDMSPEVRWTLVYLAPAVAAHHQGADPLP